MNTVPEAEAASALFTCDSELNRTALITCVVCCAQPPAVAPDCTAALWKRPRWTINPLRPHTLCSWSMALDRRWTRIVSSKTLACKSSGELLVMMQWWTAVVYNIGKYLDECVHVNAFRAPALHFLTKSHVYHFIRVNTLILFCRIYIINVTAPTFTYEFI